MGSHDGAYGGPAGAPWQSQSWPGGREVVSLSFIHISFCASNNLGQWQFGSLAVWAGVLQGWWTLLHPAALQKRVPRESASPGSSL